MILTKDQIELRLNSKTNIANLIEIEREKLSEQSKVMIKDGLNHYGRNGGKNLTPEERVEVGVSTKLIGASETAELFGIAKKTATDLSFGCGNFGDSHQTNRYVNKELVDKINERLDNTKLTIQERAAEKLLGALGLLDEEKLGNSSAKELADVASKMSNVVRNISSNNNGNGGNGKAQVKIILHQPKTTREEAFDFVELDIK